MAQDVYRYPVSISRGATHYITSDGLSRLHSPESFALCIIPYNRMHECHINFRTAMTWCTAIPETTLLYIETLSLGPYAVYSTNTDLHTACTWIR